VGSEQVALMADLFHMNIEEASVTGAIGDHAGAIAHVHLADSNRRPPGQGHTDFPAVLAALDAIGYDGALTMEFLPATANPYVAASLDVPQDVKAAAARAAIEHLSKLTGGSSAARRL
jgi:sugar phosphate isomerase/epimerase